MSAVMKLTKVMPVALETAITLQVTLTYPIIRATFVKLPQKKVMPRQLSIRKATGAALTRVMEATQRTATVAMLNKGQSRPSRTIKSSK